MRLFKRRSEAIEVSVPVEPEPAATLPDPPGTDARGRRSVADERDYLLSLITPLPAFGMYLLDAWGTAVCEDIIADQEGETRRLLAFCGLDWDARCLSFHENDAPVSTASAVQVRSPLYASSVGRWRRLKRSTSSTRSTQC